MFFFFKQKTAYEMRISDWSSDVCSSDLGLDQAGLGEARHADEQAMAAGQQGDQGLIDHRLLAEDDTADRLAHDAELVAQIVDLFSEPGVCGVIGSYGGGGPGTASPSYLRAGGRSSAGARNPTPESAPEPNPLKKKE